MPDERNLCSVSASAGSRSMYWGRLRADDRLDRAVAVGEVDALADVLPQLWIGAACLRVQAIEEVDQAHVQHRLGQREQRIDPGVAGIGQAHPLALVQRGHLARGQGGVTVPHAPGGAVAVGLEDVARF